MLYSPSSSGRLDREPQWERLSSSVKELQTTGVYLKTLITAVTRDNSHHLPAMMTEALCVGFFPILILYWFISSSICWSLCMASRQFLLLFFFTVLHSSGSLASFLAASTIFCCSANLLSRFLRKGSCSVQQRQQVSRHLHHTQEKPRTKLSPHFCFGFVVTKLNAKSELPENTLGWLMH